MNHTQTIIIESNDWNSIECHTRNSKCFELTIIRSEINADTVLEAFCRHFESIIDLKKTSVAPVDKYYVKTLLNMAIRSIVYIFLIFSFGSVTKHENQPCSNGNGLHVESIKLKLGHRDSWTGNDLFSVELILLDLVVGCDWIWIKSISWILARYWLLLFQFS